jgi:RNA polymerase sigma-70 factor (ECF subfamily)
MAPAVDEPPDAILVSRAQGGDPAAFDALFERHYERIRRFAYRVALGSQAADDIAQDTFIRVARQLAGMREPQAFVAWLYRIAANVAKNHLRAEIAHRRKLAAAAQELEPPAGGLPANAAEGRACEALRALPVDQRAAVALVYLEDCNHAEAARRLGCAESTVSWRIFLAKRTLRQRLKP